MWSLKTSSSNFSGGASASTSVTLPPPGFLASRISQLASRRDETEIEIVLAYKDRLCPLLDAGSMIPEFSEPKAKVKLSPDWSTFGTGECLRNLSGRSPVRSSEGVQGHSRQRRQCNTNAVASEHSWLSLHGKERILSKEARWLFGS